MKLTGSIVEIIGATDNRRAKAIRTKLALALNFTERWVLKCIQENKDNGPLTTMKAMQVLREESEMSDSEILEEEETEAAA